MMRFWEQGISSPSARILPTWDKFLFLPEAHHVVVTPQEKFPRVSETPQSGRLGVDPTESLAPERCASQLGCLFLQLDLCGPLLSFPAHHPYFSFHFPVWVYFLSAWSWVPGCLFEHLKYTKRPLQRDIPLGSVIFHNINPHSSASSLAFLKES